MQEEGNMKTKQELVIKHIRDSINIKEQIVQSGVKAITQVTDEIIGAYKKGKKVVWFGNGGSAADAQHLAAELLGKFYINRKALESMALTTNTSLLTAVANDFDFSEVYARQVEALVKQGDIVIGISTSGESANVLRGIEQANQNGAITVAFTGATGGKLKTVARYTIVVPSEETPRIQEAHVMIGHIICYMVERELFGGDTE